MTHRRVADPIDDDLRACALPQGLQASLRDGLRPPLTPDTDSALVAADTNRLEVILAPDFTLVTPDGQTLTRDDLIAAVRSGDLDFQAFRFHDFSLGDAIEVRLDCDIATVSYRSAIEITSDPVHYRHDSRHTDTWVRHGRSWQEIRAQTTAVGGFPPPGA